MKRLPLITVLILLLLFVLAIFFYFSLGSQPKITGEVIKAPTETPLDSIIKNDSTYADYVYIKGVGYLRKDRKIVMLTGQDTAKSRQAEAIKSVEKDLESYWKWQILLGNKSIEDLSPKTLREGYSKNDEVSRKKNIFSRIIDVFKVTDAINVVRDTNKTCDCDDDLLLLSGQDLHLIETSLNPDGGLIIIGGGNSDNPTLSKEKIQKSVPIEPQEGNGTKNNTLILVGIIDSGINNERVVNGNNPLNYNFVKQPTSNVQDPTEHGTKIARIIAHDTLYTKIGLIGLKAYDDKKIGNLYDNLCAILYATKHNIRVINASWGTYQAKSIPVFEEVLRRSKAANIVIVCSAGNEGFDIDKDSFYPACYADNSELGSHIITVTSKNKVDCQNISSSKTKIDLSYEAYDSCKHDIPNAAGNILAVNREAGTSYAAPYVTANVINYLIAHPGRFSKSGYVGSIPASSKIKRY
jgi:subtilisin family serine protease